MPPNILDLIEAPALEGMGGAVLDGLNVWVEGRAATVRTDSQILDEVGQLSERMYRSKIPIAVVSIELASARGRGMLARHACCGW